MQRMIQPESTLADLAVQHAGASRVFHRHGLDFCCNGRVALSEACIKQGLDPDQVLAEVEASMSESPDHAGIPQGPLPDFVQYILDHFHADHREEVPRLIAMARKVESVHGDKEACPHGLVTLLERMAEELEFHMQKEEQVLFPMILAGRGAMAGMPISIMEEEHQDHGKNLAALRELVNDFVPPPEACNTWKALYLSLAKLERDLMEHIHLENNALFPRALKG